MNITQSSDLLGDDVVEPGMGGLASPPAPPGPPPPSVAPEEAQPGPAAPRRKTTPIYRKPQFLALLTLALTIVELVAFGLLGWRYALIANAAILVLILLLMLLWRGKLGHWGRSRFGRGAGRGGGWGWGSGRRARTSGLSTGSGRSRWSGIPGRKAGRSGSAAAGSAPRRRGRTAGSSSGRTSSAGRGGSSGSRSGGVPGRRQRRGGGPGALDAFWSALVDAATDEPGKRKRKGKKKDEGSTGGDGDEAADRDGSGQEPDDQQSSGDNQPETNQQNDRNGQNEPGPAADRSRRPTNNRPGQGGDDTMTTMSHAADQSLQRWGANLHSAEDAAAEVARLYAIAEAAADQYRDTIGKVSAQAETELPATPRMQAEVAGVHERAKTAASADSWRGVAADAATLPSIYQMEHAADEDRLRAPRNSRVAEKRADVATAEQDN